MGSLYMFKNIRNIFKMELFLQQKTSNYSFCAFNVNFSTTLFKWIIKRIRCQLVYRKSIIAIHAEFHLYNMYK